MNMMPQTFDGATHIATIDPHRALMRRVVGFSTHIETALEEAALALSLDELAANSAFILDGVTAEGGGFRADFSLAAKRGTTGDPQIFALLRDIAARHRWNGMEKHLVR